MWRKLFFITPLVLVLALSGAVQAATDIDVNNFSFEFDNDGNQIACHIGIESVLAWHQSGSAWVGVDPYCLGDPNYDANFLDEQICEYCGSTEGCHCWPATHGICWSYVQASDSTYLYNELDPNDPNAVIVPGRKYTLTIDSMSEIYRGTLDYLSVHMGFFYGTGGDVNHSNIDSTSYVLPVWIGEVNEPGHEWVRNLTHKWVCTLNHPAINNVIGPKFWAPNPGGSVRAYIQVDNVRLEWQWASQAYNPNPEDGAVEVLKDANLTWSPGLWAKDVNGHDVYFGSTWAEVNSATTASAEFIGNQDANEYDPGTMVLGNTYYWRIDEVNEASDPCRPPEIGPSPWKGDVWSFTVGGRAKNPYPPDGAPEVPKNVILRWTAGIESKWHDVYFGTSEAAVTAATTASSEYKIRLDLGTELYDAGANENPIVGEQYFWRIDEVNTMTVKGHIWDFTVANYVLIDDFDFYANPTELRAVWKDYYSAIGGDGVVWVNKDPNYAVDGNSMLFEYWNDKSPAYSETRRDYSPAQDWSYSGNGVTALEIDFFGDMNSAPDPPMYVKLSDGTTTTQVNHPDFNEVLEENVHTWNVPLKDFSGVTLSNITSITLGIGDKVTETGGLKEQGTVYFDDIRLQPPRCIPGYEPAGDFTGDCRVDVNDLRIIVGDWCKSGGWYPAAIPTTPPVVEYLFEEGTGTTVANTGSYGSGYDLTIGMSWDANGDPVMEPNNDPCWVNDSDPCRGWTLWFDGEYGVHPNSVEDYNGGDYLVMPAMNLNSNTVSITAWIKPAGPQASSFTGLVHHSLSGEDEGVAGMSYGSGANWVYDGSFAYVWNENDQKTWAFESDIFIPEQQWSFVALVIEPEQAILYQKDLTDPNLLEQAANVLAHSPEQFDGRTLIAGDSRGHVNRFFGGQMDDVRIYDVSLGPGDILGLADIPGIVYVPLGSDADVCVGIKNPTDPCAPVDDQIDLCDYSKFADEWLETKLWPEP